MKVTTAVSLDPEMSARLAEVADRLQVTRSAVVSVLLRFGFSRMPEEVMGKLARSTTSNAAQARKSPGTRRSEVHAHSKLTTEWQTFAQLRSLTGQGVGVLHRALHALEKAGLAELDTVIGARDAKNRDVNSRWRLKEVKS